MFKVPLPINGFSNHRFLKNNLTENRCNKNWKHSTLLSLKNNFTFLRNIEFYRCNLINMNHQLEIRQIIRWKHVLQSHFVSTRNNFNIRYTESTCIAKHTAFIPGMYCSSVDVYANTYISKNLDSLPGSTLRMENGNKIVTLSHPYD